MRQNVYDYSDYGSQVYVGHFNMDTALSWPESTRMEDCRLVSVNTGRASDHQRLLRTKGGRWVLHSFSERPKIEDRWEFIDENDACKWLSRNDVSDDEVDRIVGVGVPEESGPMRGRPREGERIYFRLQPETIDEIDTIAAVQGLTRAAWLRKTVIMATRKERTQ